MNKGNNIGRLLIFILVGLIAGGVLGEALGAVLGQIGVMAGGSIDNPVRNTFVKAFEFDLGFKDGWALDLYTVKLRFGLGFKFNLCSLLGMILSLYVMKWSKS